MTLIDAAVEAASKAMSANGPAVEAAARSFTPTDDAARGDYEGKLEEKLTIPDEFVASRCSLAVCKAQSSVPQT